MLKIERTTSWQVEGPDQSYCCTTYSKHDALVCKKFAEQIPKLKCLKESSTARQPRGIYIYLTDPKTGEQFPEIETYDPRLARRIRKNIALFKGDF